MWIEAFFALLERTATLNWHCNSTICIILRAVGIGAGMDASVQIVVGLFRFEIGLFIVLVVLFIK